jgi:hypothetical protein
LRRRVALRGLFERRLRYLHGLDKRADYVFGVGEMRRRFHAIGE